MTSDVIWFPLIPRSIQHKCSVPLCTRKTGEATYPLRGGPGVSVYRIETQPPVLTVNKTLMTLKDGLEEGT